MLNKPGSLPRAESPLAHTKPLYGLAGAPIKSMSTILLYRLAFEVEMGEGGLVGKKKEKKEKLKKEKKSVANGEEVVAEDTTLS